MTTEPPAIADYAAIGDGRTVALVSRDGSIDWLCLPDVDSDAVFAALLDPRAGSFRLAPAGRFTAERRYLEDTNVLETTFSTPSGRVRVVDAFTLPTSGLAPARELVRHVTCDAGEVELEWSCTPRFGFGLRPGRLGRRGDVAVACAGGEAVGLVTFGCGETNARDSVLRGSFTARPGPASVLALVHARGEPLVLPSLDEAVRRLEETAAYWRSWAGARTYDGPWREAVVRSALALKLLVFAPSGAMAAAATTSLPERPGGDRNWDYRLCWLRDSVFTVDAFLSLGCTAEATSFFSWLMHATALDRPRLRPLYRLDGSWRAGERTLPLRGYRASQPVRVGNAAVEQLQLDVYGETLATAALLAEEGPGLDRDTGGRLAAAADETCRTWRQPDAGIWEHRDLEAHFTWSKMACAVALECAARLSETGSLPRKRRGRWLAEAREVRRFVEERCWNDELRSYTRFAGSSELDASVLLASITRYADARDPRVLATIEAIRRHLAHGPLVYRRTGAPEVEGAFLACSLWLAHALALSGRPDEAAGILDAVVARANDVGLLSEEIDPVSGELLGNFPQALSHLALVNAAVAIGEAK